MAAGKVIEVAVEMSGFDDDPALLAVLGDAFVSEDPVRARPTFRFAPRATPVGEPAGLAGLGHQPRRARTGLATA